MPNGIPFMRSLIRGEVWLALLSPAPAPRAPAPVPATASPTVLTYGGPVARSGGIGYCLGKCCCRYGVAGKKVFPGLESCFGQCMD
eukprot:23681-Chlamydomonas_euryale.AAC.1